VILIVFLWLLACSQPDKNTIKEPARNDGELARKRLCAELGRIRLADDRREYTDPRFGPTVFSQWCFNRRLNTCIYSSVKSLLGKASRADDPPPAIFSRETIDLLTNRTIISVPFGNQDPEAEPAYQKKLQELYKECL
jgi:hypothetical protein